MALDSKCNDCGLYRRVSPRHVNLPELGKGECQVVFLGSAPSSSDDRKGVLYGNAGGVFLRKMLSKCGFNTRRFRFTTAVRCYAGNKKVLDSELRVCGTRTLDLINEVKPKCIIASGQLAVDVLASGASKVWRVVDHLRGYHFMLALASGQRVPVFVVGDIFEAARDSMRSRVLFDDLQEVSKFLQGRLVLNDLGESSHKIAYTQIFGLEGFRRLMADISKAAVVSFDIETRSFGMVPFKMKGEDLEPSLVSIAFSYVCENSNDIINEVVFLHGQTWYKEGVELLGKWIFSGSGKQIRIAHNLKYELLWISSLYRRLCGGKLDFSICEESANWQDTRLMRYTQDSRTGTTPLKFSCWVKLGVSDYSVDVKNVLKLSQVDLLNYNVLDSFYTLRLYFVLKEELFNASVVGEYAAQKYALVYSRILMPSVFSFTEMEERGNILSLDIWQAGIDKTKKLVSSCLEELFKEAGKEFNPGSSKQLAEVFLGRGVNVAVTSKGNPSLGKDALKLLQQEFGDKLAGLVLRWRDVVTLNNNFLSGLEDKICEDGCTRASYNVAGTVTGRTSCSKPNQQNFPKRPDIWVRDMFVPPAGHKLVAFDYGQLEARLLAIYSGDPVFIRDLHEGFDIHKSLAIRLYKDFLGWDEEKAIKMRGDVKGNIVFASLYGASNNTIAGRLDVKLHYINQIMEEFYARYGDIKSFKERVIKFEQRYGYTETLFGRRRRSPINFTEILNSGIQGSGSDCTLASQNVLQKYFQVAMMIHDELVFYIPEDEITDKNLLFIAKVMLSVPYWFMSQSRLFRRYTPLSVSASLGDNWGSMKEVFSLDSADVGFIQHDICLQFAGSVLNSRAEDFKDY